jgi:undecaprenyl-diphosphatase
MLLLDVLSFLKELDTRIFLLINGLHAPFLDSFMQAISFKFFWIPLYLFFLILLIKQYKIKTVLLVVFVALTITLSDQICLHFFKNVFMRYRPCHNLLLAAKVHLVDNCGGKYGFISSHAANSFALAFFLFQFLKEKYIWATALFVWAALVGYSRIYLGQHYPSDILVGAIVGISIAWLTVKLYFYTQQNFKNV